MIKILVNNGDGFGDVDYTKYVLGSSVSIQQSINAPTTCSLSVVGTDSDFVVPARHAYIKIYSTLNKRYLFTGFIISEPAISFIGLSKKVPGTNFQMYQFNLSCTSDDYLLNIKSVPFLPAFVNMTQGQIIKSLANTLCPGFYNLDHVDDGDLVPYLAYDPTQSWYEYVKGFGDGSRYRYSCVNKEIHYKPYGDGDLGIVYDDTLGEGTFDPKGFTSSPLTTPMVNDVTMLGMEEAGNNREDYFIGTGFDGAFQLAHKVFGLSTQFQGSSVLLSDAWNSKQLNAQNWHAQDPASQFNYGDGALNIISGFEVPLGMSYIYANNVVELAGSIIAQHGEVIFNDTSKGIIGGFYNDSTLTPSGCLAGIQVTPGPVVVTTISGASGIEMTPMYKGSVVAGAFVVTSKVNKTYTMFTRIASPAPVRYYQVYRSMAGSPIGGYTSRQTVVGSITFAVTETDIFSGEFTTWTWTASGTIIPDTAVYGLVNNQRLNITLNSTELWTPPPASLRVNCQIGSGALGQFYISGNVQYTGAFITPSGGNLPILPQNLGPEQQFDLGSGIGNQVGELDSGQQVDTLDFYNNDLPGAGTRIHLQSWESQQSVSRMQDVKSIALEAAIVGDDGIRASSVTNLNPLPRTSEDCDNAGAAFLTDRVGTYYQGSYKASYYFFNQWTNDIDFYPVCGRFLFVNSPNRNIKKQNMLVTSITTTITELAGEIIQYNISFGPDKFLEKVLSAILPQNPAVFQPVDTAIAPIPQKLAQLGTNYLPDLLHSTAAGNILISGGQFNLALTDTLVSGGIYELRSADWNWGQNDGYLINRYVHNQNIILPRSQYDQSWFLRMVAHVGTSGFISSRRTKVIRIVYPRIPTAPVLLTADTANVNMDLSGDTRNIEGLEIRQEDDETVCYQCLVGTRADSAIDMDQLRNQLLPGQQGLTGLGKFLVEPFASGSRLLKAHFFNLLWEYSPTLTVSMPAFSQPIVSLGYRWGPRVQVNITPQDIDVARGDVKYTHAQFFNSSGIDISSLQQDIMQGGNTGMIVSTFPVTGDLWIRAQFVDHVSSGDWSDTLHIPQGDLIASDYLAGQGSIPPAVLANLGSPGGILTYLSESFGATGAYINLYAQSFRIWFPNDAIVDTVPTSGTWTVPLDATGSLLCLTDYGFFPSLKNALSASPFVEFGGPYANYGLNSGTQVALTNLYKDGSVPMTNGAFVVQTASSGAGSGGVAGFEVTNGGFGYHEASLAINGDGSGAVGIPIISNSQIAGVKLANPGSGYTHADCIVQGDGINATVIAFLSPSGGGSGTSGGGGAGSNGGGGLVGCGILSSLLTLASGKNISLLDAVVGDIVKTPNSTARIGIIEEFQSDVCKFKTDSGLESTASLSHTVKSGKHWVSLEDLLSLIDDGEEVTIWTINSECDKIVSYEILPEKQTVRRIRLKVGEEVEHYYLLDGIWCHNVKAP